MRRERHGIVSPETEFRVEYRDLSGEDRNVRRPDITESKRVLGWEPVVGLEEGLERTVDYFREREKIGFSDPREPNGPDGGRE